MPQVVVSFKEEDENEAGEALGPVFFDLVVESEDDGEYANVVTEPLGKLPWWFTRSQAREIADENGWYFNPAA